MQKTIAGFFREESGATAIEYALIAALIGTGLVIVLHDLGQGVTGMYADIGRALDGVRARMN